MSEIVGYASKDALPYATKLGEAMQITNILRVIKEDYEVDRIYLPYDLMVQFNVTEEDIANGTNSVGFQRLVEYLASKADALYKEAEIGIQILHSRSRFSIIAASKSYQGILGRIRKANYDVFKKRHHVSLAGKISMMLFEYLKTPFRKSYEIK
jgi:phytoene synthase